MPRYRQVAYSFGPPLTPVVKRLIVVTSAVFVVTYLLQRFWSAPYAWLPLRSDDVLHRLYLWELVSYMFIHWGFFHIIFNMFALWMFGSDLESLWGRQKFLFYYFLTGIGAGICVVLADAVFSSGIGAPTAGSSGAIYGLLLAYGMLFPDRPIYLYFFIPIKAKWFVLIFGGIEFLSSIGNPGSGVSHVAHLGGMLFGYLYLRGPHPPHNLRLPLRYQEWRRARLRRKFEVYMRKHERKDDSGRWIN
jgi:membrane associated rhomboid family serine protease